jgi:sirohydrochlorin cobaltochelatase
MMLVAAGHGKGDIPGAMARELVRHPGLDYVYGRPLGPHPTLLALLEERLDAALGDADRAETAVLLVGRGSTDPDANAEICKVARLLWEGRGLRLVEPAFVSLAEPSVPQGLERCRLLLGAAGRSHGGETQRAAGRSHGGETQRAAGRSHGGETRPHRVVVLPYFLFPGVLPDRVLAQTQAYAAEHPELDVRGADVIGDCDGLADLVVERYEEAIEGDIRMNCDTCIYRIAMPGFENRVGVPQTPHQHPDDPSHGHAHAH